jgi:hypothetical protein
MDLHAMINYCCDITARDECIVHSDCAILQILHDDLMEAITI